ncbi:MAG: TonB-dependent receptor, partial [Gammaproteobacteria bacterium]|nr:TonB-dependent receptor [Gammaproteobacteria bacterium]
MKTNNRLVRLAVLQALTCASGLVLATPDKVNADPARFDIAAQPLPNALKSFAAQAKMQLLYRYDVVSQATARPVTGELEKHAALEQLLRGTGLEAVYSSDNTATIRLMSAGEKAAPGVKGATGDKPAPVASPPTSSTAADPGPGYLRLAQVTNTPTPDRPTEDAMGEIIVTGIRSSMTTARAIKRDSDGIVDAIAPEDIGKLPDTNLAESLQRITGVSIDRSGGEGEFITVRGFGPEFNTVLVNGRQIATPTDPSQASGRAFSFDTLASELVSGVEVYKSSTARLQSGGVGSTVNIKTARPFDYGGFKFSGSADMNHDQNSGKSAPDASFLISDVFADGRLGALLSGSYQKRHDELRAATTDGWIINGG